MAANTDNNTTIARTIKLDEETRTKVEQSPSWKYESYNLVAIKDRLEQQGEKLTKRACTIKEQVTTEKSSTIPMVLNTTSANDYNDKWHNMCKYLSQVVEQYLIPKLLVTHHQVQGFTEEEKKVDAMLIVIGNDRRNVHTSRSRVKSLGNEEDVYLYILLRMIYEYIHNFDQDLQALLDAFCIIGDNVDGEIAYQQKMELCHTTHLPPSATVKKSRDCNPKNTYFANHTVNLSSMHCSQHPEEACSCPGGEMNTRCHNRLKFLTYKRYVETVQSRLLDHLNPFIVEDSNGTRVGDEGEICEYYLSRYCEAFERNRVDVPRWMREECQRLTADPPVLPQEVVGMVSTTRRREHNRQVNHTPDLDRLDAHVFGEQKIDGFESTLKRQTELLKQHEHDDTPADYLSIKEGTSDVPGTLTLKQAKEWNKQFYNNLLAIHEFHKRVIKTKRISWDDKRLTINEEATQAWSIGSMELMKNTKAHASQLVKIDRRTKQGTTMMKFMQMYYEVFNEDLVIMYDCLKIQGLDISGRIAYLQKKEMCHTHHTFSRDLNYRHLHFGSHSYNVTQNKCSNFPWTECKTCINKCHPRLHELTESRLEKEVEIMNSTKMLNNKRNKSKEEIKIDLANCFKDAYEREDEDVPGWIMRIVIMRIVTRNGWLDYENCYEDQPMIEEGKEEEGEDK